MLDKAQFRIFEVTKQSFYFCWLGSILLKYKRKALNTHKVLFIFYSFRTESPLGFSLAWLFLWKHTRSKGCKAKASFQGSKIWHLQIFLWHSGYLSCLVFIATLLDIDCIYRTRSFIRRKLVKWVVKGNCFFHENPIRLRNRGSYRFLLGSGARKQVFF